MRIAARIVVVLKDHRRRLACGATTLNLRNSNVPEPVSDPAWKAEMIRCPAFAAFDVISMPELSVPA